MIRSNNPAILGKKRNMNVFPPSRDETFTQLRVMIIRVRVLVYLISIVKQALFAYVIHAWINSWNQPVLSNVSLLKETTGAFDGARIHAWQGFTDFESDALPASST